MDSIHEYRYSRQTTVSERPMPGDSTSALCEARLRSSSRFRLLSFDELDASERQPFESLSREPDFYGVLIPPPDSALPVKSVSRDAALLFQRLRDPGRVPHLLKSLFGSHAEVQVQQLILDGILEVEIDRQFLSGTSALRQDAGVSGEAACHIARLSNSAIQYGSELQGLAVSEVATRLYLFNRIPGSPSLQCRFAENEQIIAYLSGSSACIQQLASHWVGELSQGGAWFKWRMPESHSSYAFKLYISPAIDALPETFRLTVDVLARTKCPCFKVGLTAFGLLRPDKFVAYFACFEDLQRTAEQLQSSIAGLPAHGVPFTAAIDAEGLLSWGMDPPLPGPLPGTQKAQSWRQWITERIAVYLVSAREDGTKNITAFVHRRLAMDGVDTLTWSPNLAIWRDRVEALEEAI
ncbi:hypothetical protein [Dictyobacter kobayashii]|uniref:Uncharacterized protein n=1 Tax=Dictyobacter kobayashii TaxID=2014872 RepID=A0A402AQ30_9CHLR|nr:hypothetical protein [Dictyobacter kobayashii]GCE21154.1 hypothetical protein KDK_49540 [Dictyobacter kobayashii]